MAKQLLITINGKTYDVVVGDLTESPIQVSVDGEPKQVSLGGQPAAQPATQPASAKPVEPVRPPEADKPQEAPAAAPEPEQVSGAGMAIKAPMPGKVLSIRVSLGDDVKEGDIVCTLEAMKMEMPISATAGGKVTAITTRVGANVAYDDPLIVLG